MMTIKTSAVDAVLDQLGEDEDPTTALVELIDSHDAWRRDDDNDVCVAILESSGAYWAVSRRDRATGYEQSRRCASENEAGGWVDAWIGA